MEVKVRGGCPTFIELLLLDFLSDLTQQSVNRNCPKKCNRKADLELTLVALTGKCADLDRREWIYLDLREWIYLDSHFIRQLNNLDHL